VSEPLRQEFEALQARWRQHCRDGDLPRRSDFPPESLGAWLGHIQVVEAVRVGEAVRFRVRLVGTRIVYYEGHDNTGLFLDDVIPADDRDAVLAPYRECMDSRQPVYTTFYSCASAAISSLLERLILPLSADGDAVDQFLVAIYRAPAQV
jgi:hypothetical protein